MITQITKTYDFNSIRCVRVVHILRAIEIKLKHPKELSGGDKFMTANQINYGKLIEENRSNMRQEELTQRRDSETARNNQYNNMLDAFRTQETVRHNRKTERQALRELRETTRSHKANERISSKQAKAALRTARANLANAKTNRINAATNQYNAATSRMDAYTNVANARTNAKNARTNVYNAHTQRRKVTFENVNEKANIAARKYAADKSYNASVTSAYKNLEGTKYKTDKETKVKLWDATHRNLQSYQKNKIDLWKAKAKYNTDLGRNIVAGSGHLLSAGSKILSGVLHG